MIKEYFYLQFVLTNRKLKDFGFNIIAGYLLIIASFLLLSFYLFHKVSYAQYIYLLFPLYFFIRLSNRERNDFLKINFPEWQYQKIRIIENLLITLPFALFLCLKQGFLVAAILIVMSVLFSVIRIRKKITIVIPTPFSKHPFEFTVGFRNSFFLFPVAYYVATMAIVHNNFNLGVVSLGIVTGVVCCFYFFADNIYYIWIFSFSPSRFLNYKIKKALLYTSLLSAPVLLSLSVFDWQNCWILWLGFILGCLILVMFIFAKYAAFPNEVGIKEFVLIGGAIVCFPLILFIPVYFRNKAIEKLKPILSD